VIIAKKKKDKKVGIIPIKLKDKKVGQLRTTNI
jgi:hypothetical protein